MSNEEVYKELYKRQCEENIRKCEETGRLKWLVGHLRAINYTREYRAVKQISKHVEMNLN